MNIQPTEFEGLFYSTLSYNYDHRGAFGRVFCQKSLEGFLQGSSISQINHSLTADAGTIRGMHFQTAPYGEKKIVRCLKGKVFDVVIDLRSNSPTFLKSYHKVLSEDNNLIIMIPEGFAHGFQALENNSELLYFHSTSYTPQAERGVRYNDPAIKLTWPLPPKHVSDKDLNYPLLSKKFTGIDL